MSRKQPKTTKTPTLRFPEFSGEWEFKNLKNVFDRQSNRNSDNQVRFVLTNSATRGIVSQFGYFDKDIANQGNLINYHVVDIDNFVYNPRISKHARVGPLKRNNLKRGIMSPLYTVLKAKKGDLFFLEKYFETTRWHRYMFKIANYGARHDRMNILQDDFMKMPIPFPNLEEQHKIASFLTTVDDWIENLKKQKESLEEYKKGMLQKLFSQEIKFRDENGQDYPEWEEKRLGEIASFLKGKGISKEDIAEDGKYECIRYGELYTHYSEIITNIKSRTNVDSKNSFVSKEGDVIVPSSGETALDIATVSCVKKSGVLLGSDLNVLRLKNQDGDFIAFYLSNYKNKDIARLAQGNSVVHLYSSHLKVLKVNLPTRQEQRKIASFLSSIDDLIDLSNQRITLAEEWKKGLMQGMFV